MPELPEVETVCRALQKSIAGQDIASVTLHREGLRTPFPKDLKQRLEGQKIVRVDRRAKYILMHLADGDILVLHLGMSGRILIHPVGRHQAAEKHDHMVIVTGRGTQMIFNDPRRFGMAFTVRSGAMADHPAFRDLGPEPLDKKFSGTVLAAAFAGRKTSVKAALLDQHTVAGIGNIYACEALFDSRIDPQKMAAAVPEAEMKPLAAAIKKVLRKAIDSGGSTLRNYRRVDGDTGSFQHRFSVYDREGKACPGCTCDPAKTGGILRITQGGRSTFYCPRRQK